MSRRGLKIIEDETYFIPNTLSAPVTTDNTDLGTLGQLGHSDQVQARVLMF